MKRRPQKNRDTGPTIILRAPAVVARVGLCRRSIDRLVAQGKFPPPRRIGAYAVGWVEREVEAYLAERVVTKHP